MYKNAYKGKTVLVTGNTGFKGAWLSIILQHLGATVLGYALAPPSYPNLMMQAGLASHERHTHGDIRDTVKLTQLLKDHPVDFVFHLAAQPLVLESYENPLETFDVNVMGSLSVLEAIRLSERRCVVVMISTDKCYENQEWHYGYRETDPMGGYDPYSASKGAMEIAVASYRRSFFHPEKYDSHGVAIATARAGNVIGGGDWADNRIVPDIARALLAGESIPVRNPQAVRPWQHVLEPLSGYLWLGASLALNPNPDLMSGWNFGPHITNVNTVRELVEAMIDAWGSGDWLDQSDPTALHEATLLQLSIDRASAVLGWSPVWDFQQTIRHTATWYKMNTEGTPTDAVYAACIRDIEAYEAAAIAQNVAWAQV